MYAPEIDPLLKSHKPHQPEILLLKPSRQTPFIAIYKAMHLRPARLQGRITRPVQDVFARLISRAGHIPSILIPLTVPRGTGTCTCQRLPIAWRSLTSEGASAQVKHCRDLELIVSWKLERFSPIQAHDVLCAPVEPHLGGCTSFGVQGSHDVHSRVLGAALTHEWPS